LEVIENRARAAVVPPAFSVRPALVIGALLILTLTAIFSRLRPYPTGWIILSAAFISRWLYLKAR